MAVTLKDIAKRAGVTVATVSMALRDHHRVSRSRREQIQELARAMGYRPNPFSQAMKLGRSMSIGIVVGSMRAPVQHPWMRAIEEAARAQNYWLYLTSIGNLSEEKTTELIADLLNRRLDGLIVCQTHRIPGSAVKLLRESTAPVVYLGRAPHQARHQVALDTHAGIHQVAAHLAQLGHRRAHLFATTSDAIWPAHRVGPYHQALQAQGIEVIHDQQMVLQPGDPPDFGQAAYRQVMQRLARGERPTALVMTNDHTALGAIAAVHDHGLRVPEDVSVVGFDDLPYASQVRPALTTVRQPREPIGELAFDMLFKLMSDPNAEVEPVLFTAQMIARQSTGPASGVTASAAALTSHSHPIT